MAVLGVLLLAVVIGLGAFVFGLWATVTKNAVLFGRQTALANIYSLVLAALVASTAMAVWSLRNLQGRLQTQVHNGSSFQVHPQGSSQNSTDPPMNPYNGGLPPRRAKERYLLGPPRDTADFVGRQPELARIEELTRYGPPVSGPTVVVITGPSGIGKSALLVHAAYQLAERFGDQIIYVDMRGYSDKSLTASDALSDLLRTAGVDPLSIPRELHAKSSLYRAVVCADQSLVLVDNADSLEQVEPLLPGRKSCAALIASRSNLFDLAGAEHINLGPLSAQEAQELFAKIVGKLRVTQEVEAAKSILKYCGYLPLAIRIAGARVASRPHRPIAYLLNKITDERGRLSELKVGNLEMRTSFEISYRSQPEIVRKLYRRLSLVSYGEFPYWIGSVLLQADLAKAMEAMDGLVEAQLVVMAGTGTRGYYQLHDLLLTYARECLEAEESESDQAALRNQMIKEYAVFIDCADRKIRSAERLMPPVFNKGTLQLEEHRNEVIGDEPLTWFRNERTNLLSAMNQARELGEWELAWVLGFHISYFLEIQGYWNDWLHAAELALQAARAIDNSYFEALALRILARGFRETGTCVPRNSGVLEVSAG